MRTVRNPPKWGFPLGRRRALRAGRVATTSTSYVRENSESNSLIGVSFESAPIVRTQGCVDSDTSSNDLDPGDIPLAATQHQPAAVQEVRRLGHPFLAVDTNIVDVRAALTDRPPCGALAAGQTARHQQICDRIRATWLQLGNRRFPQRCRERRLIQLPQF